MIGTISSSATPRWSELLAGIRAQLPILLGTSPFGMIYGILAVEADLPVPVALGMSLIVFAGSSQFIAAQLFASGTPGIIIVLTTFIVNLRHMLYSASLAPYVRHLTMTWRSALAFLLTDEAYAVTITRYRQQPVERAPDSYGHWYFLGAGLTLWVSWQISTMIGVFVGAQIPSSWSLDFTLALTFIALVIPALTDRPAILSALVAGIAAVGAYNLPYNLGLILAVLLGIGAGVWAEGRQPGTDDSVGPQMNGSIDPHTDGEKGQP
ncbi:MAG: AzlC family ABC transporter permease [Anaerolineae bacterium]|nr:AzlC family ABC transporter permease [Anaerolineae bacterium]